MVCFRNRTCVVTYIYIDCFLNFISPGEYYLKGDYFFFMSDNHTFLS